MTLYIGMTVLVLVMAFYCRRTVGVGFDRQRALNVWMLMGIFVVLGGVAFCRIANSNDYWVYVEMFSLISQKRLVSSEFGFNLFVRIMQLVCGEGKFEYIPIFGAISFVTIFFSLKAIYEQSDWFMGSLFLFMMNGLYFSSFNSIRYYLVLAFAAFSFRYVMQKQYGRFLICILFAATFHKSVLVVIPVYLVCRWLAENRLKWYHYVCGAILLLSLVFGRDIYRRIIFTFYEFYEGSEFDVVRYSYTNIAKCLGTFVLCVICRGQLGKENLRDRFLAWLNVVGLVTYTFGAFIPEVSRIAYYFTIGQIFLIPNLLFSMEKGWKRNALIAVTTIAFVLHFALFLRNAYSTDIRLLPYMNWIFN